MPNFTPSKEDVDIWLEMADSNHDGQVELEEYEDIVIKSLTKAGIKVFEDHMVI